MKYEKSIFIFGISFLLLTNCMGTEIGNPPATDSEDVKIDFVVQVEPVTGAGIGNLALSADIEIDEAILVVRSLRFRNCDLAEDQAFKSKSFIAELLREQYIDSSVSIKRGKYCRLDIQPLRGGQDGEFSDREELQGYTLYAKGTYQGTPLIIRYEGDDEISFLGEFTIDTKSDRLFIAVDLKKWFEDVELSDAEKSGNDIILGDGTNLDLLEKLKDNYESSIQVAVDQNNDGILDRIELDSEDEEDQ